MNGILAVVILTGSTCISPVEQSGALNMTVVGKVPCAVVFRNPVTNPFKIVQEPNVISASAVPVVQKVAKKSKKKKRRNKR